MHKLLTDFCDTPQSNGPFWYHVCQNKRLNISSQIIFNREYFDEGRE